MYVLYDYREHHHLEQMAITKSQEIETVIVSAFMGIEMVRNRVQVNLIQSMIVRHRDPVQVHHVQRQISKQKM